jgi:hypothetical protein
MLVLQSMRNRREGGSRGDRVQEDNMQIRASSVHAWLKVLVLDGSRGKERPRTMSGTIYTMAADHWH